MSKPSQGRKVKKAKFKKKKLVRVREAERRVSILESVLRSRHPNLKIRHTPIKPYDLRVCGDCQVCCHAMAVIEVDSLKYENCKHQCPSGCGIHQKPPDECVHFECTWKLEKTLGNDYRPDQCGFMLYAQKHEKFGRLILLAIESYEGAWKKEGIYKKLALAAHKMNILIVYLDKNNKALGMYGPPDILEHAQKILTEGEVR